MWGLTGARLFRGLRAGQHALQAAVWRPVYVLGPSRRVHAPLLCAGAAPIRSYAGPNAKQKGTRKKGKAKKRKAPAKKMPGKTPAVIARELGVSLGRQ